MRTSTNRYQIRLKELLLVITWIGLWILAWTTGTAIDLDRRLVASTIIVAFRVVPPFQVVGVLTHRQITCTKLGAITWLVVLAGYFFMSPAVH